MRACFDCAHGTCMDDGYCDCDAGWSGQADFLTNDLSDWGGGVELCQTPVVVLKFFWGIPLLLQPVAFYCCTIALVDQINNFREQKRNGVHGHWFTCMPIMHMLFMVVGVFPSSFCLCLFKVLSVDMDQSIGVSPPVSIAFAIDRLSFSFGFACHLHNAASLALRRAVDSDETSRLFGVFVAVVWTTHTALALSGLLPVLALLRPPTDEHFHEAMLTAFFATSTSVFFCVMTCCVLLRRKLEHAFMRMIETRQGLASMRGCTVYASSQPLSLPGSARSAPRSPSTGSISTRSSTIEESLIKLARTRDKALALHARVAVQNMAMLILYPLFFGVPLLRASGLSFLIAMHMHINYLVGLQLSHLYASSDFTFGLGAYLRHKLCICRAPLHLNTHSIRREYVMTIPSSVRALSKLVSARDNTTDMPAAEGEASATLEQAAAAPAEDAAAQASGAGGGEQANAAMVEQVV